MNTTEDTINGHINQAIIDFLMLNIPIFSRLTDQELKTIEHCMELKDVSPEEIIFEEGDQGDFVCFVLGGTLDVTKKSETGEDILISTLSRGRSIGEMAVIDALPRSATVKSRGQTILLILSREKFDFILEEHSIIGVKILKGIARLLSLNLRKTSSKLVENILPLV